MYTVFK